MSFVNHFGHSYRAGIQEDRAYEVSALDPNVPVDSVPLSQLAGYIRDAKRSMHKLTVVPAQFEAGTESGDLVYPFYLDDVWYRAQAGVEGKERFAGVAFPELQGVLIGPGVMLNSWHWKPGSVLYLSDTKPGKMQYAETSVRAGFSVHHQFVLLNVWDSVISAYVDEVLDRMQDIESGIDSALQDINVKYTDILNKAVQVEETKALIVQIQQEIEATSESINEINASLEALHLAMQKLYTDTDARASLVQLLFDKMQEMTAEFEFYWQDIENIYGRLNYIEELVLGSFVGYDNWGLVVAEATETDDWGLVAEAADSQEDWGDVILN